MQLLQPDDVSSVLGALRCAGFEAFLVGGCVRDSLLAKTPCDWDIATSALPEETQRVFAAHRVLKTGLCHGTLTVLWGEHAVEVTTYRVDGAYLDARHPDHVQFSKSLLEDLARRDFTINAMAYSPSTGLVDPFLGRVDLQQRVLRCVGKPQERFAQDALRMLRGARFAATLGFAVEEKTAQAMLRGAPRLSLVAPPRVAQELLRLLCGDNACAVLLRFAPLITTVLPELAPCVGFLQHNPHHPYDVYKHSVVALQACPPNAALRFALLLHDSGKPSCFLQDAQGQGHFYGHSAISATLAQGAMQRLGLSTNFCKRVLFLIRHHDMPLEATEACVLRCLNRFGEAAFRALLLLKHADYAAQTPSMSDRPRILNELEVILERVLKEKRCFCLHDLALNGHDLLQEGVAPGPAVGRSLQFLLQAVLCGACTNTKTDLLAFLNEHTHDF